MSLIDLKRKKRKVRNTKVDVDDFIEDAVNYATGQPSKFPDAQDVADETVGLDKKTTKIFRHATFTLTETSIEQLNNASLQTNIAKSRLIRILVQDFVNKTEEEQQALLDRISQ
ncbi:replication protein RepA [Shewanella gelidii]|uniref:Replication protein RepA n=1 Tax=Shewanella gelidii TaxID=1642821 RepID=A0A917JLV7_9GAMM|nr:replication protein RepA [Shewanella gelidii]MCL1097498.1 replication protein RepA [Shewanella gelidii]GGI75709.1 replication protein RepA [Shewanella gelidii]